MRANDIIACLIFMIGLFGLTSLASRDASTPDKGGAIAAALSDHFLDSISIKANTPAGAVPRFASLCIDSDRPLEIGQIASALSDTIFVPIAAYRCTSKTVEGDFGMYTSVTHYYDPSGAPAVYLGIPRVHCATDSICVVDIDDFGQGKRYTVKRSDESWRVERRESRWIV